MKKLLFHIKMWARRRSFRKAKKQADKEHATTNRKVFVVLYNGEFIALTKRRLKQMRRNGLINNDTVKQCESIAVYVTK
jgi:hypothetical protein